jgi:hypothetical protein
MKPSLAMPLANVNRRAGFACRRNYEEPLRHLFHLPTREWAPASRSGLGRRRVMRRSPPRLPEPYAAVFSHCPALSRGECRRPLLGDSNSPVDVNPAPSACEAKLATSFRLLAAFRDDCAAVALSQIREIEPLCQYSHIPMPPPGSAVRPPLARPVGHRVEIHR